MENQFEMVFAIVNSGYSGDIMEAVKACGATGGTIINSRGTANTEIEKFFGISISSEKEIVVIIIPNIAGQRPYTSIRLCLYEFLSQIRTNKWEIPQYFHKMEH